MEIKAQLKYLRIAPRKVRLVADLIRGMDVKQAEVQLKFMPERTSVPLLKLLNSAVANAKNSFNVEKDALVIDKILINEGPPFKRWRARARGRAFQILKKTSHINLVLGVKPSFAKATESKEGVKKVEPVVAKSSEVPTVSRDEGRKPKFRAPKEISKKPERKGLFKKMFRRKSF